MENIDTNIKKLEDEYKLIIPKEYIEFVKKIDMFQYSWSVIKIANIEFELNHFLGYSEESSSQDLYTWYIFANDIRLDYLTIAMGFDNEEIAIKVKGDNLGQVALIYPNRDDEIVIKTICENFNDFIKILNKGEH